MRGQPLDSPAFRLPWDLGVGVWVSACPAGNAACCLRHRLLILASALEATHFPNFPNYENPLDQINSRSDRRRGAGDFDSRPHRRDLRSARSGPGSGLRGETRCLGGTVSWSSPQLPRRALGQPRVGQRASSSRIPFRANLPPCWMSPFLLPCKPRSCGSLLHPMAANSWRASPEDYSPRAHARSLNGPAAGRVILMAPYTSCPVSPTD